jgi:hypothetical protein
MMQVNPLTPPARQQQVPDTKLDVRAAPRAAPKNVDDHAALQQKIRRWKAGAWAGFDVFMDVFTASVAALDMVSDFIVIAQWLVLGLTGWAIAGTCIMTLAGIVYMGMFIDAFGLTDKRDYWIDYCGGLSKTKLLQEKRVWEYIAFGAFHLLVSFPLTLILSITVGQLCPFALWAYNIRQTWRDEPICVPDGFKGGFYLSDPDLLVGQVVVLRDYMAEQLIDAGGLLPGEVGIIVEKVEQPNLRMHLGIQRQWSFEEFVSQVLKASY